MGPWERKLICYCCYFENACHRDVSSCRDQQNDYHFTNVGLNDRMLDECLNNFIKLYAIIVHTGEENDKKVKLMMKIRCQTICQTIFQSNLSQPSLLPRPCKTFKTRSIPNLTMSPRITPCVKSPAHGIVYKH